MLGIAGNEKDDVRVTVDLSYREGVSIKIVSKMDNLYGEQMKKVIADTLKTLNVVQAKVICEDFGGLDFVIRARVISAVRKAKEVSYG